MLCKSGLINLTQRGVSTTSMPTRASVTTSLPVPPFISVIICDQSCGCSVVAVGSNTRTMRASRPSALE